MRGIVAAKLHDFLAQVNQAAAQAKQDGVVLSPELVRANLDKLSVYMGEGPALAYVKDTTLMAEDSKHVQHAIPVRVYSPAPKEALPVVMHYHGGGHMCGSIELYDAISRKIADKARCIVIAVEYRLAPEHPYPAGIDDCQFALENYQQALSQLSYSEQLVVLGDSAGGAICTSLVSRNLNNKQVNITKQILIYPSVDYTMSMASVEDNSTGFLLETAKVAWYFDNYFCAYQLEEDVRRLASPLFMPMNQYSPKTLVFTAGCDPLRDEGIAYVKALEEVGADVQHQHLSGMIHAYMLLDSLVASECQQTYQLIADFIQSDI